MSRKRVFRRPCGFPFHSHGIHHRGRGGVSRGRQPLESSRRAFKGRSVLRLAPLCPRNSRDGALHRFTAPRCVVLVALFHPRAAHPPFGSIPGGSGIFLHPVGFAGWTGLYVTSINLMPIGQLDGGHVSYALLGRIHRAVSILAALSLALLGVFIGRGGFVGGALAAAFAETGPPPVADGHIPLSGRRKATGALSLAVFALTFMPMPFYIG